MGELARVGAEDVLEHEGVDRGRVLGRQPEKLLPGELLHLVKDLGGSRNVEVDGVEERIVEVESDPAQKHQIAFLVQAPNLRDVRFRAELAFNDVIRNERIPNDSGHYWSLRTS